MGSGIWSVTSQLQSDLRDTVEWAKKWLVDFNAGKIELVLFDRSNNTDGSVLEENSLLRCRGWLSLLNWIGALALSPLLKLPPGKLLHWLVLWSFFLLRLLCISTNIPYSHAWNTFFSCCLVSPGLTLGHSQGNSLTNPMLVTAFQLFSPEGHRKPRSGVGSLSPVERLVGCEQGTNHNALTH